MIVLWLASILAGAAWGSLSIHPPHKAAHEAESSYSAAQPTNDEEQQETIWSPTTWTPITFFTAVVATFSVILAVANLGLWGVTYCSLRHSRKTAEQQLRAYLMPKLVSVRVGNNGITIYITMKNFGQTPAAKVSSSTSITVTPEDVPEPDIRPSTYTVGPGATFDVEPARQVGEERIAAITEKRETAFFRAKFVYQDAFEEWRYTDMQGRLEQRRGEWILRATEENNGHS